MWIYKLDNYALLIQTLLTLLLLLTTAYYAMHTRRMSKLMEDEYFTLNRGFLGIQKTEYIKEQIVVHLYNFGRSPLSICRVEATYDNPPSSSSMECKMMLYPNQSHKWHSGQALGSGNHVASLKFKYETLKQEHSLLQQIVVSSNNNWVNLIAVDSD